MAYKIVDCGDHRKRRNFSKIKNTYELSDLLEIQKKFEKCNGTFETFSEEDTLYIRGTLPLLGGGVS